MTADSPVKYCTRCGSLNITEGKGMKCLDCDADAFKVDVTSFGKYVRWHMETFGTDPTAPAPTIYDDLEDSFNEEAEQIMTENEALNNGMNVGPWLNRDLRRFEK